MLNVMVEGAKNVHDRREHAAKQSDPRTDTVAVLQSSPLAVQRTLPDLRAATTA
jgi:hypothetical protein